MLNTSSHPTETYGHMARMNDGNTTPTVGQLIRAARERIGMGQNDMAKAVGVEGATAYRWEAGKIVPGIERLSAIAGVLGVPVTELVPDDYDYDVSAAESDQDDVDVETVDNSPGEMLRWIERAAEAARGGPEAVRAFNEAVTERAKRLRARAALKREKR